MRRLLLAVVVILTLGLISAQAQPNYYIAFSAILNKVENVYIMRDDGTGLRNLTRSAARDWHPTWSPDGKQLAFVSTRSGNGDIHIINLDDGSIENLTQSPDTRNLAPEWSPDGSKIVFVSDRDGGLDLYTFELATRTVNRLTRDSVEKSAPTWFPNSQQVAYWAQEGDKTAILVANTQGGQITRLTSDYQDSWPAISPDGNTLAFERVSDGFKQIYLKDIATDQPPVAITSSAYNNTQPAWSADGQHLAFVSDRDDGIAKLYVMKRDGSGVRLLPVADVSATLGPSWQPVIAPIDFVISPGGGFGIGQSFERVTDAESIRPEMIEVLGRSEARLLPEPPINVRANEPIRVRVEVTVNDDGTVTVQPTLPPVSTNNIGSVTLTAYTYMSAELRGLDLERFEIDPPPSEIYMIRLRADQVNFWEWELRPRPEAVGQTSYLSVKFFLPSVDENGVLIRREGEGVLRFEVNVAPELAETTAAPLAATAGRFRFHFDAANSLTLQLMGEDRVDGVGLRTPRGEGWFDADFRLSGRSLPANTCLIYQWEDANASIPDTCTSIERLSIPYGDIFWYDFAANALSQALIIYSGNQHPCDLTNNMCDF